MASYQAGVAVDYYWEGEEDLLFQEEALVGPPKYVDGSGTVVSG